MNTSRAERGLRGGRHRTLSWLVATAGPGQRRRGCLNVLYARAVLPHANDAGARARVARPGRLGSARLPPRVITLFWNQIFFKSPYHIKKNLTIL